MDDTMARPTALVTGASYGVGSATALALARDGYDVAVSATRSGNVAGTAAKLKELGARVVVVGLDLRKQSSIEQAFDEVVSAFGTLDLLVNNAGANLRKWAVDVTAAEWDEVIATNLTGTFFISQQFGRHLIAAGRPGCIVSIASTHGLVGAAERSTYGISKAAIIHMTRMLAIEWAEHGIRVNAVAPGRLDTASPSRAGTDPKYMEAMLARIPMHRLATAEEVAAAVCYLAGAGAASITGHTLVLDGGLTAV
jgi:NAD(P)-dependent dehydrogenase (short-subunit alcohol dehydrogenase family)